MASGMSSSDLCENTFYNLILVFFLVSHHQKRPPQLVLGLTEFFGTAPLAPPVLTIFVSLEIHVHLSIGIDEIPLLGFQKDPIS